MIINSKSITKKNVAYTIRSAVATDAEVLSQLRVQIDGETEFLDREPGEGFLDAHAFERIIQEDNAADNHLFIVVEVDGSLVGFARCAGSPLKRLRHQTELGICLLQAYCGVGIGTHLLRAAISWADANGIRKILLKVLETNTGAIALYKKFGFETEGVLRDDKRLSDGQFYNTIVMGRLTLHSLPHHSDSIM